MVVPHPLSPQSLYGCSRLPGYTHVGHRPALFPWPDNQTFEVGIIWRRVVHLLGLYLEMLYVCLDPQSRQGF